MAVSPCTCGHKIEEHRFAMDIGPSPRLRTKGCDGTSALTEEQLKLTAWATPYQTVTRCRCFNFDGRSDGDI